MGDIVGSEAAASPSQLHDILNKVVTQQNKHHASTIASPLTITLGDEFQGLVETLADGVTLMRTIRLELLKQGVECRFALGLARLETPINRKRAWNMMGPGLADTRAILDEKRSDNLYRFFIPNRPAIQLALEALGATLTAIEKGWTKQQLNDITQLLGGLSVDEVARHRQVSAHSVYKVRSSGNFDLYARQWNAIVELLKSIDKGLE
ncbi:SatD family protein [Erythrobacter sp.]|uniref:SatD family protein n=1 Tax=Erythrobacter sp. TaxID=1042 RepID=UPI00262E9AB5|nr:SatD family protein [Erythrobacter sp.]